MAKDRQQRREQSMNQYIENINYGREVRESLASLCGLLRASGRSVLSQEEADALVLSARNL